jgi:hypothetical protein
MVQRPDSEEHTVLIFLKKEVYVVCDFKTNGSYQISFYFRNVLYIFQA